MKSVGQTFPSRNKKKMWNLYNKWYFLSIARIDMLDVWIFHYIYNSLNHVHCYQFDYLFDLSITFFFLSFFWWVVCLVKSLVIWVKLHNWVSDRLIKAKFAHNYTLWRVPVNFILYHLIFGFAISCWIGVSRLQLFMILPKVQTSVRIRYLLKFASSYSVTCSSDWSN